MQIFTPLLVLFATFSTICASPLPAELDRRAADLNRRAAELDTREAELDRRATNSCKTKPVSTVVAAAKTPSTPAAAAAKAVAAAGSVLTVSTYNALSISSGTAGSAKANALAKFPIDMNNLAGVSAADLKIIQGAHDVAENAEVKAFNPAIAAASGAAATALKNGKIANKVLKLTAEVLGLKIQQAQGKNTASQIATEQAKLTNNIALDTKAAGQAQTAVSFAGSD